LCLFNKKKNMKRARDDSDEDEDRDERVLIDDIDATLTNIPEEMRKEVYSHIQWAIGGEKSGWHLESVMQVSKLLYTSIYEVARVQFKILAETTTREMNEWGGWTVGRPRSLVERFDDSPLGAMKLSYAWCMHHFYVPSQSSFIDDVELFEMTRSLVPTLGAEFSDYMNWVLGLAQVYSGFDDESATPPPMRPKSHDVTHLYLYFCYAALPSQMITILEGKYAGAVTGAWTVLEWGKTAAHYLVNQWIHRSAQEEPLFFDWLVYFENNGDFGLNLHQHKYFMMGAMRYFHGFTDVNLPMVISCSHEYQVFLTKSLVEDDVYLAWDRPLDRKITTFINNIHITEDMAFFEQWQARTGLTPDRYSGTIICNAWADYILKPIAPTLPLFARWMHHIYPSLTLWGRLAALPPRPGDPPMSDRLKEILGLTS
jgi:hypothetical protein